MAFPAGGRVPGGASPHGRERRHQPDRCKAACHSRGIEDTVERALVRSAKLEAQRIDIEADGSTVVLNGTVRS